MMDDNYGISSGCGIATIIVSVVIDTLLTQAFLFCLTMKFWRCIAGDYLKVYCILFYVLIAPFIIYWLGMSYISAAH